MPSFPSSGLCMLLSPTPAPASHKTVSGLHTHLSLPCCHDGWRGLGQHTPGGLRLHARLCQQGALGGCTSLLAGHLPPMAAQLPLSLLGPKVTSPPEALSCQVHQTSSAPPRHSQEGPLPGSLPTCQPCAPADNVFLRPLGPTAVSLHHIRHARNLLNVCKKNNSAVPTEQ